MENNKHTTPPNLDDLLSDFDLPVQKQPTANAKIRKMTFTDSSMVHSLEYDGELLTVNYVKGAVYTFPMDHDTAMSIYTAPSVGKALIATTKAKEIKGTKVEQED